ncbi:DUF982 domain-containing protein [Mesorhizobium sp. AaZ16]|uniref:DUF982 domain-containing protein n=1 Tax=Mesorhizobium sp. AaZ16 TaxID=3402289 RepID=UPI00374F137D
MYAAIMKDRSFHAMVVIEPRIGRYRYVRSAADAGKVLLRAWPDHRGAKHQKALEAVLEVLKGNAQPSAARNALIAAAEESGILVDAPSLLHEIDVAFTRRESEAGTPVAAE